MYSMQDTPKGGFPHSEICASKVARTSSQLIAACYVLHRLLVPRHPLNALLLLEISSYVGINPNDTTNTQPHNQDQPPTGSYTPLLTTGTKPPTNMVENLEKEIND